MTIALVYDTETTGMVNHKAPHTDPGQPGLVQLAAILCDETRIYASLNLIVKPFPGSPPLHPKAIEAHGITEKEIEQFGVDTKVALAMFSQMAKRSELRVAHNLAFDDKVMKANYHRLGIETSIFDNSPFLCTMLKTTEIAKIPGKYGKFKWPQLIEAYKVLIDPEGFEGAHDAMVDTKACMEIYRYLVKKGIA